MYDTNSYIGWHNHLSYHVDDFLGFNQFNHHLYGFEPVTVRILIIIVVNSG